jgi:hypothetical protein
MIGFDIVLSYLATWTLRRAGHAVQHVDDQIDQAINAGLDRLNDVIMSKLRAEPALAQFRQETLIGHQNPRTRQRVVLALEEAVAQDRSFAVSLQQALERLSAVDRQASQTINSPWVSGNWNKVATGGGVIDSTVTTNNVLNQNFLVPILESTIPGRVLHLAGIALSLGSFAGWLSIIFRAMEDNGTTGLGPNLPSGIPLAAFYFITVLGGMLVAMVGLSMKKAARSRQHWRVISQALLATVVLFGVVKAVDYAKGPVPYSYLLPHLASCKIPQHKAPAGLAGFGTDTPTLRQWACVGKKIRR